MDKTDKFLKKLSSRESIRVMRAVDDILSRKAVGYDVKRLKGYIDVYRVRIGVVRIIYRQLEDDIEILDIGRRSEKTYKDY